MNSKIILFSLFLSLISCQKPIFKASSASFAKELCTCLFVLKHDEQTCVNYAKQAIPVGDFKIDSATKNITVFALGRKSEASYLEEKLGCQLK